MNQHCEKVSKQIVFFRNASNKTKHVDITVAYQVVLPVSRTLYYFVLNSSLVFVMLMHLFHLLHLFALMFWKMFLKQILCNVPH